MKRRRIVLVVENVRSCHNVGSLLRTADGIGIEHVYLCGYTPYPRTPRDSRLPHVVERVERQISKTALGADKSVGWSHRADILRLLKKLESQGFILVALEQTEDAVWLPHLAPTPMMALIIGSETRGLSPAVLKLSNRQAQIPMLGQKESLNVAAAAAIGLYHLRFGLSDRQRTQTRLK